MKFKKILALLMSVSMLACFTACGKNDDSQSSKAEESAEDSIERVTVALDEEKIDDNKDETKAIIFDEDDIKDSIAMENDSKADENSGSSNSALGNMDIQGIAENYDPENPEETVIEIIETGLGASIGDDMKVDYDDSTSTYTIDIWQDGMAYALSTKEGAEAFNSMIGTLESSFEYLTTQVRLLDDDANVVFNFVSDEDQKTPLVTIENGQVTYNITD